jgi:hypothetical protein
MTQEPAHGPVVAVGGLPGVGKTAFVAAYAWRFSAAFPGGVFWSRIGGGGWGARKRYADQLAETARLLGLPTVEDPARVRGLLAARLSARGRVLWIVDDIPADADADLVHDLVLPAGSAVRTVLVSDRDVFGYTVPLIRLDGLSVEDASALLESSLPAVSLEERAARDRIVARLGGHVAALTEVARLLRDIGGELSHQRCEAMIMLRGGLLADSGKTAHSALLDVSRLEWLIIRLAAAGDFSLLDVGSTAEAVVQEGLSCCPDEAVALTVSGLRALEARFLANQTEDGWRIHPLALRLADPAAE